MLTPAARPVLRGGTEADEMCLPPIITGFERNTLPNTLVTLIWPTGRQLVTAGVASMSLRFREENRDGASLMLRTRGHLEMFPEVVKAETKA